jgi:hypothetical protein
MSTPILTLVFNSTPVSRYPVFHGPGSPWAAIFRDSPSQHAAGLGQRFKNGHRIPALFHFQRGGHAGRAGADNGDFFRMNVIGSGSVFGDVNMIGDKPFEVFDGQRFIEL